MSIPHARTHLGPHFSEGARSLWLSVRETYGTQGQMARALGCDSGQLARWLYGDTRPSLGMGLRIRDVIGVPLDAWVQPPLADFVPPAVSAAAATGPHRALSAEDAAIVLARVDATGTDAG